MTESTSEVAQSASDMKSKGKEKEIPVVQDRGVFTFDTGDTYDGFFEARKKDRSLKMHGNGVYTTAEGDIYCGVWEYDKLGGSEEVSIKYSDGSKYEGLFKDWCYHSRGKYYYPDGSVLQCEFQENCPVGKLRLTDPNNHVWLGKAEQGYGWFSPSNHYFDVLEKYRDLSKIRRRPTGIQGSKAFAGLSATSPPKKFKGK